MAVRGLHIGRVSEADVVSVVPLPSDLFNNAICCGNDRRAERRAPIYTRMHFGSLQDRVTVHAETVREMCVRAVKGLPQEVLEIEGRWREWNLVLNEDRPCERIPRGFEAHIRAHGGCHY